MLLIESLAVLLKLNYMLGASSKVSASTSAAGGVLASLDAWLKELDGGASGGRRLVAVPASADPLERCLSRELEKGLRTQARVVKDLKLLKCVISPSKVILKSHISHCVSLYCV